MPSIKSLLSAFALAYLANATTIKITATSSNTFDPSTIKANDGDVLEFIFEPKNHSVVAGDYRYPCSPLELGTGFFSGFFATSSGENDKVFRVEINGTDTIPFYSSQGNECAGGMVGIINPKGNQTLDDYKKRASTLARSVSPGRTSFGGEIADNDSSSDNSTSGDGNGSSGGSGGSSSGKGGSSGSGSGSSGDSSSDKDGKDNGSVSLSISIGALALAFMMAI
ncbi:hypothetical protein N5P37_003771 [Trichoderma harzianum]|uniref:Phytocyanin domain-containing protein n=1 Tax=Trichoderma harzianum CBS 226.95 TaxID=983964 RepID=A0A2T4AVJ6_TRIHA|nr:hypothetical protein M431DRAFT_503231 [Trichoderma harzianum CBS 226.95]KAK0764372.1 hypothetical protein N5P37_003771 [Trichoderma harzianum]PKK40882.1 hypothetical protein CI102_14871 [Trichoderma harzianum]PTB61075.1 hypothetical protein M431DRAFT_503231 [Trichoderma harzianum CBS 226.95]